MNRMRFMNIELDNISFDTALERCCALAAGKTSGHFVVTPNVDHIVRLEKDSEFAKAYREADLVLVDGKPLIWIAKVYGNPIVEKISGSDLFPRLCSEAAKRDLSMFFFGAQPGVANKAAINLSLRYPGLNVVGTLSPDFGFESDLSKVEKAISKINASHADILVVGLGCPKQEKFIYKYRSELNVKLSLGLGASLDFEAGNVKRAPEFMREHGLEWLYRIGQEPRRLAKRYITDAMRILPIAFKYRPTHE